MSRFFRVKEVVENVVDFFKHSAKTAQHKADGKPKEIDMSQMSIEDKKTQAAEFSDGSISLYNLLSFCFKNNLRTTSSCSGHIIKEPLSTFALPYITIDVGDIEPTLLKRLLAQVLIDDPNTKVEVEVDYTAVDNDEQFRDIRKQITFRPERRLLPFQKLLKSFQKASACTQEQDSLVKQRLGNEKTQMVRDMINVLSQNLESDDNKSKSNYQFIRRIGLNYSKDKISMSMFYGRDFPFLYISDNGDFWQVGENEFIEEDGKYWARIGSGELCEVEKQVALSNCTDVNSVKREEILPYSSDGLKELLSPLSKIKGAEKELL